MAVKLRLTRMGRRHRPFFRLNAIDSRCPRDGKILEKLGHYDPIEKDKDKQVVLNKERIEYWISVGAVPSDSVAEMLAKNGIVTKAYDEKQVRRAKAKAIARAKGKPFDATERAQVKKEAEAKAVEAEAKAKAAEEAAKVAEQAKKATEESAAAPVEEAAE